MIWRVQTSGGGPGAGERSFLKVLDPFKELRVWSVLRVLKRTKKGQRRQRGVDIGHCRITQLLLQEFSSVTKMAYTMPICSILPKKDRAGGCTCNLPGNVTHVISLKQFSVIDGVMITPINSKQIK